MLTGFILGLLTAASEASKDLFFSQAHLKRLPHIAKAFAFAAATFPVVLIPLLIYGIPEIKPSFWYYVSTHAVLMVFATYLYMRALALGPVSQTQPILALTPVFLIVTNPLMTDDFVPALGWVGVLMVAVGIYATSHPGKSTGKGALANFVSPFVEMVRQPGVLSKLGVALIFAVTANLDKLSIQTSSVWFYLAVDYALLMMFLSVPTLVVLRARRLEQNQEHKLLPFIREAGMGGVINGITVILHMNALNFLTVPYLIALKRLSIVGVSGWGYFVRKERQATWYRLIGTLIVVTGIAVIMIFGR